MRLGRLPQNSFDRLSDKALPSVSKGKRMKKVSGVSVLPDGRREVTISMVIQDNNDADIAFFRAYTALKAASVIPDTLILTINARRRDSEKQIKELLQHYNALAVERKINLYPSCVQVLGDQRVYTLTMMGALISEKYVPAPGALICMAGFPASGTLMALAAGREQLSRQLSDIWIEEAREYLVVDCDDIFKVLDGKSCFIQPVSEGGVLAALWDLKEECGAGFSIDRAQIIFRQETIEICDILGLNPYQLSGDGAMLIVCDNNIDNNDNNIEEIEQNMEIAGIPFKVLGRLTKEKACIINTREESTCLDRPEMDGIWQLTNMIKEEKSHERSDSNNT